MFISPILLLLLIIHYSSSSVLHGRLKDITLDEKGFIHVKNLHYNWYMFSIKALLAQLGKEIVETADVDTKYQFVECLSRIKETREVEKSARCLVEARYLMMKTAEEEKEERKHKPMPAFVQRELVKRKLKRLNYRGYKRHRKMKKSRSKRSPYRLVLKEEKEHFKVRNMDRAPNLPDSVTKSPVKKLSGLFVSLFSKTKGTMIPKKWARAYKKMGRLQKKLEENEESDAGRVYRLRMHDLVLGRNETEGGTEMGDSPLLNNVFRLTKSLGLKGVGNVRVLSPRVAPLVPQKNRNGFFSPSILPFYKDETEDQILPVPDLLEKSGMDASDRDSILQMVMELSGARETVQSAMKVLKYMDSFGIGDELFEVTKKISKTFETMRKSFGDTQKTALKKRGFTLLEPHQMRRLHDAQGIAEKMGDKHDQYYNLTSEQDREAALWSTVEKIAQGRHRTRVRRQTGFPVPNEPLAPDSTRNEFQPISVLSPVVLEPYAFAPVFGLAILGPVVLSPNIFSPLILNPSVLGPWVLSPSVPLPFILSPYLLSPYVLSPLAMAPFILTPYVLSPNVINPYVLSPLVLSPLVLCPDVLSPMALGGPILSPGVLSPSVFSKSVLMANILSPSILS